LTLLESEIVLHFSHFLGSWQLVLSHKVVVHMLQELVDKSLMLGNLFLVLDLFLLELLHKFVDFLFLLVKNLVLLSLIGVALFLFEILLNLFNASLVVLSEFFGIQDFLVKLHDLIVVHLDSIQESFSCLGERKVELIGLKLQLIFLGSKLLLLFSQVLGSLLQGILLESRLGLGESGVHIVQLVSVLVNRVVKAVVLFL
jgi:hypothetical protein